MAKTKYIVPVVAMMLCVVSLIGAGYAAYSAKLTDTESITADNQYFDLKLGDGTDLDNDVDLAWDTEKAYSGGVAGDTTWKLQDQVIDLGMFMVAVNENETDESDPTTYNLAVSALTATGGPAGINSVLELKIYTNSGGSPGSEVASINNLAIGTLYHVVLVYDSDGGDPFSTTTKPTDITLGYTLTATANIA